MKRKRNFFIKITQWSFLFIIILGTSKVAQSASLNADQLKRKSISEVKKVIEPILKKYCDDQCKLLSSQAQVTVAVPDELEPGFDINLQNGGNPEIEVSEVKVNLLIGDLVGPNSKKKLLELIDQHFEDLPYPVEIETKIAHFPQPIASSRKVAEIKERISKEFTSALSDLIGRFCPQHCLLGDYDVKVDPVNPEEAQYGSIGEFVQDGDVAVKINRIEGTILTDSSLSPEEQYGLLEMAKLKTGFLKNVYLDHKSISFPQGLTNGIASGVNVSGRRGLASSTSKDSKSQSNSEFFKNKQDLFTSSKKFNSNSQLNQTNENKENKSEKFVHYEKIERVEDGDIVQSQIQEFEIYSLIFAVSVLSLLIFIALATYRPKRGPNENIHRFIQDGKNQSPETNESFAKPPSRLENINSVAIRYEIERLQSELTQIFGEQPRVAKQVFSRILTEEGVEVTACYIELFGEAIVVDMLRDPSLQTDLSDLMEYYAKNPVEMDDNDKLELLKSLHNRTIAAKMFILGHRSTSLFDFLAEMDKLQVLELIRNESITVKAIVLTQTDPMKRTAIYAQMDEDTKMRLLTELSRIDHLPKDYIYNVAVALKRKRSDNPKLNTEALPGSDVLVSLLERANIQTQKSVMSMLNTKNPDSAHAVKSKLVSVDTLAYLRDNHLLEVVLGLKHEELIRFLKGSTEHVRNAIFAKSPQELVIELQEEIEGLDNVSRDEYQNISRKILNRVKVMANDGSINLIETNEKMFAADLTPEGQNPNNNEEFKKVAGW